MTRLRVLLLTHVFPRNADDAAAPFLLRYAQALVEAGLQLRVLAPHDEGLPEVHDVGGVPVRRVRYGPDGHEDVAYRGEMHVLARNPQGARKVARLTGALRRALRREARRGWADVLDVHWLIPCGVLAAATHTGLPAQLVVHGTDVALATATAPRRTVATTALRRFELVTAASAALAAELDARLGRRADAVAPMPPRAAPSDVPAPPGRDAVLAVGRLVEEKGYADLIDAVALARARRPTIGLTIVGDGPERARLRSAAERARVPLDLVGSASPTELEAAYAGADLVVLPSRREGFGLVAAEALLRERPVVATAAGGLSEIVEDGVTGWSVPVGDTSAFADAIVAALDDPDEAARRATAGRERVDARWSPRALGADAAQRLRSLAERS